MEKTFEIIVGDTSIKGRLTTDHPASSYGIPVILVETPAQYAGVMGDNDFLDIAGQRLSGRDIRNRITGVDIILDWGVEHGNSILVGHDNSGTVVTFVHSTGRFDGYPDDQQLSILGHLIQRQREKMGLSKGAVAKRAGISSRLVTRIENASTSPRTSSLGAIGQVLGLDWIVHFKL